MSLTTLTSGSSQPIGKHAESLSTASRMITRSNAALFVTNLHLLDLDKLSDWPDITARIVATKTIQQNQKNRIRCVEWALYRLFELWDHACGTDEAKNRLQPFFPPLEPLQSLNLRAALFRCLSDLKKNGVLGRDVLLRKTMLDECKGERFEEVLLLFSTLVLRKTLKRDALKGQPVIARRLAMVNILSADDQRTTDILLLAHKDSLRRGLQRKVHQGQSYEVLRRRLATKHEEISQRAEAIKARRASAEGEDLGPGAAVETIKQRFHDSWLGDSRWLQLIFEGDHVFGSDAILEAPFETVWSCADNGTLDSLRSKGKATLLDDLQSRLWQQKSRLNQWKRFQEELDRRKRQIPLEQESDVAATEDKGIGLDFSAHKHLNYAPGRSVNEQSKTTPTARSQAAFRLTEDIDRLLNSMHKDLAQAGKTRRPKRQEVKKPKHSEKVLRKDHVERKPPEAVSSSVPGRSDYQTRHKERLNKLRLDGDSLEKSRPLVLTSLKEDKPPREVDADRPIVKSPSREEVGSPVFPAHVSTSAEEVRSVSAPTEQAGALQDTAAALEGPSPSRVQSTRLSLLEADDPDRLTAEIVYSITNAAPSPSPAMPGLTLGERTRQSMASAGRRKPMNHTLPSPPIHPVARSATALHDRTRQSMSLSSSSHAGQRPKPQPTLSTTYPATPQPHRAVSGHHDSASEKSSAATTPREELFNEDADYASVFRSRPRIQTTTAVSPERAFWDLEDDDEDDAADSPLARRM